eukprot:TRINITY_DN3834_c0_g1_i6.p1 TRINITY_DN3834_c0_g1~~TRINITY_DN3834_c0_g1_i6.p1  ORF type:complete len:263 (-),score=66.71 TRINITY_DN3834_c0_g1_i6:349-1137(-)
MVTAAGVTVCVSNLAGEQHQLLASHDWTVRDLKVYLEATLGTPILQQRLLLGCTFLSNDDAILSSLLNKESFLHEAEPVCRQPEQIPCALSELQLTLVKRTLVQMKLLTELQEGSSVIETFERAAEELKADKEVALAAVKRDGWALRYAAASLKADRDVVLAAVRQKGMALQYVAEELTADREVVRAAVDNHSWALQFVAARVKADKEFVLECVRRDGVSLNFVSKEMARDKDIVLAAVEQNPPTSCLPCYSPRLTSDRMQR